MSTPSSSRPVTAAILGCAALMLVGWTGLLVPALIRSIERDFGQTDAGIGIWLFLDAVAYVAGSMLGGLLTERFGRRIVLGTAVLLMALGLAGLATVPSWGLFLAFGIPFGFGSGAIDGGTNGLILELYPASRGRALNVLHLFFSLGALGSPLVVGRLAEAGMTWQSIVLGSAFPAMVLVVLLAVAELPSGRHARVPGASGPRIRLAVPLVALAFAIGCYVASEVGVSDWLVQFLATASIGLATSALALFWGCLALGRLVSAKVSDRFDHARLAAIASLTAGLALIAAVLVPSLPASILLFGAAGFAYGPIYPLIMAVAGDRFPDRSAAVSGFLAGCAVIGAIIYPPIMGFLSVGAGLGVAMIGAAILAMAGATVLFLVGRTTAASMVPE